MNLLGSFVFYIAKLKPLAVKGMVCLAVILLTTSVYSNPVLNNVGAGNVSIQQTPNSTVVNQSSQKAILNWHSFNIGQGQSTHFQQPAGGVALNRISPLNGSSAIYGKLTATGQIILVNPAGIYFGPSAYVNVGGLIATTADISDQNFLNGNYRFDRPSPYANASIINEGRIIAANHGLVALVGGNVVNNGLIQADLGRVVLASGDTFTIQFAGNDLISFSVDGKSLNGGVVNTGTLRADGGKILVTAKAAQGVLDNVINMGGYVQARSVYKQNGEIILSGDPNGGVVKVAAKIDASGRRANQKGGTVSITGHNILIDDPAVIDVSGRNGGGNINIGGNYQGKGPLPNANAVVLAPNAKLLADATTYGKGGNVILWSNNVTKAYGSISARGGSKAGNGGFVETSAHGYLDINGIKVDTSAPRGDFGTWLLDPFDVFINSSATSNGSFSGANPNVFTPSGNNSNVNATQLGTLLGSTDVTITTTGAGAQSGDIYVQAPITWSAATTLFLNATRNIFFDTGSSITATNGTLRLSAVNGSQALDDGTITSQTGANGVEAPISVANFQLDQGQWMQNNPAGNPTFSVTGNFQIATGTTYNGAFNAQFSRHQGPDGSSFYQIADVFGLQGLATDPLNQSYVLLGNISASTTSNWNSGAGFVPIGTSTNRFAGIFEGSSATISNLFINRPTTNFVGLFGSVSGDIEDTILSSVNITGQQRVGGLAGQLVTGGQINNSSVLSGTVTGTNSTAAITGGLVGHISGGAIGNTFSGATVTGTELTGGLVGWSNGGGSTIATSYATGNVTGTGRNTGGLVGQNDGAGGVTDSYASGSVSGTTQVGGLIGQNISSNVTTSYSIGNVSASTSTDVGGLIGQNSGGTITNSFWNTQTSGQASSAGGSGLTTAQMMVQASFTGFDFSGAWGIIANQSFPYLQAFFPTTPRAVSGSSPAAGGTTVRLAANGTLIDAVSAGANGFFYFLESNGTIANATNILTYLDGGASQANAITVAPGSGGSVSGTNGLTLTANTVQVGNGDTNTFSNTILNTAKGALSDIDILYSVSGSNLTLSSGVSLNTSSTSSYNLDGNVTTTNGSMTFGGPVALTTSPVTLTATTSGNVIFSSTLDSDAVLARILGINSAGITRFSGIVGGIHPLSVLQTDSAGTTEINGGAITTNSAGLGQSYGDNVNLGANAVLNAGAGGITFSGTINSLTSTARTLATTSGAVVTTFSGAIGGTNPLASLTTTGPVSMSAGSVITTGAQTYNNNFTLGAGLSIDSSASNGIVTFGGTVNGANSLSINSGSGAVNFNSTIGLSTAPTTLASTGSGTVTFAGAVGDSSHRLTSVAITGGSALNGGSIFTSGLQTYTGAATLGAGLTINSSTGNGVITFGNTLNGTQSLAINSGSGAVNFNGTIGLANAPTTLSSTGSGTVTFGAAVGDNTHRLTSIAITGGSALNGGSIFTSGLQTYTGAVTIGADLAINSSSGNGVITFSNTINGANALSINSGSGTVNFNNSIGLTTALTNLSSTGSGTVAFGGISGGRIGDASHRLTSVSFTGPSTFTGQGFVFTTGAQTYTGAVSIPNGMIANSSTGNGAITFGSTVNSGGSTALSINSGSGPVTFNGDVGLVSAISGITSSGSGTVTFNGAVGDSTHRQFSVTVLGPTIFNGGSVFTTNQQNYVGAVTLGADLTLDTQGVLIGLDDTIDGAHALTINAPSSVTFGGAIGLTNALTTLTSSGAATVTFSDAVGDATHRLTSVAITGDTNLNGGSVFTSGAQTYSGNVSIDNSNLTLNSASGNGVVTFGGTVNSPSQRSLAINSGSGAVNFNSTIGNTIPISNLASTGSGTVTFADNVAISGTIGITGASIINGSSIISSDTQTYSGAVTLGSDLSIDSSTLDGSITFGSTVNGAHALAINSGAGDVNFNGTVGLTTALTDLSSLGSGTVTFGAAVGDGSHQLNSINIAGGTNINGGSVFTSGTNGQVYSGNVTLGANTVLNAGLSPVTFGGTLDSFNSTARSLTATGTPTFDGAVGATNPLLSLTTVGATAINGGSITTNGAGGQFFNSAVTMNADTTLNAGIGTVGFASTVDSFDTTARALAINSSNTTTFSSTVGAINPFASITTDAGGTTAINGTFVETNGAVGQVYNDNVTINANTNLIANNGNVTFGGTLNSFNSTARSLNIGSAGTTTFNGAVGGTNPFSILSTDVSGQTAINADITTTILALFSDPVTLNADVTINGGAGSITFNNTLNSLNSTPRNLTLNTSGSSTLGSSVGLTNALGTINSSGTGSMTFSGAVGDATHRLTSVTVTGASSLNGGSIFTSGLQTYTDVVVLGADTTINSATGNGVITFGNTVNGAQSLAINSGSGAVNFNNSIGLTTAPTTLSSTGSGTVTFSAAVGDAAHRLTSVAITGGSALNGGSIFTSGSQTYTGAATLGAGTTINSSTGNGAITFGNTLNGAQSLAVNSGAGAVNFNGAIGLTTAPTTLSSTGSGTVTFGGAVGDSSHRLTSVALTGASNLSGGSIFTSGAQTYTGAVSLGADTSIDSSSGNGVITFSNTVNGANALSINSGSGAVNFNSSIGLTTAPTNLASTGSGTVTFAAAVGDSTHRLTSIALTGASNLNGGSIFTSGLQTYTGAVALGADTTINSATGNGVITFGNTIDGAQALSINSGSGAVNFNNAIGLTTALTTLASVGSGTVTFAAAVGDAAHRLTSIAITGGSALNGGSIFTSGAQTYSGAATLGADTTINSSSGNGAITFSNTLNGAQSLAINSGSGAVNFNGAIGLTTAPTTLSSTGSGIVTFGSAVGDATHRLTSVAITGGSALNGGSVFTSGAQTYTGAVILGADNTIDSSSSNGIVTFSNTVNGANALSINSGSGAVNFNGAIGLTTAPTNLASTGSGTVTFAAAVGDSTHRLTSVALTGPSNLNGGTIFTSGNQTYTGAATLGANTTFDSGTGNVSFGSTLDSDAVIARIVSINSTGTTQFNGAVGGTRALGILSTNSGGTTQINGGSVTTNSAGLGQSYGDNVTLGANTVLNAGAGGISFSGMIDSLTSTARSLATTSGAVVTTFSGAIGSINPLASLTTTGQVALNAGSVITTGAQNYNNAITLGATTQLTSSGDDIIAASTINGGGNALTISNAGTNSSVTGVISNLSGFTKSGVGTLTLSANNTYTGDTTITGGTLQANNANNPFGTGALILNNGSNIRAVNVGGTTLGNSSFQIATNASATIDGAQDINIGANGTLNSGSSLTNNNTATTNLTGVISGTGTLIQNAGTLILAGANTNFNGTLNWNSGVLSLANNQALGNASIGITNGNTLNLNSVNLANNAITLNTGTLSITGNSVLGSAITIASNSTNTIMTNVGSTLTLNNVIDGSGSLSLQGAGSVTLNGNVGMGVALSGLTSDIPLTIGGGAIQTTGAQTYNSTVTLAGDTNINAGGNVGFMNTVNGAFNMNVVSGGTTTIANLIGAGTALNSIDIAANNININTTDINTTGSQSYSGAISFGSNMNMSYAGSASLTGSVALNGFNVNATGTGANNTFAVDTGAVQTWAINNLDQGSVDLNGNGTIGMNNMQNMTGGSGADTFLVSGAGQTTGTIDGGGGNNTLTVDNANATNQWTVTATNSGSVNGTVTGFSNVQNLSGGMSDDEFYFNASARVSGINGGGGTNTMIANNNSSNAYSITGTNTGSGSAMNAFSNIQNITGGGGNDSFALAGGSISGNLSGGGGSNTLVASNNVNNNWNIMGTNLGTLTGIGGAFSSMQNLTGGIGGNNTFVFSDGAMVTGLLNGGSIANQNTLNYAAYSSPVTVKLMNSINNGLANTSTQQITNFSNINNLVANDATQNTLTLPTNKPNKITFTSARQGFINDPTNFSGFSIFNGSSSDTVQFDTDFSINGNTVTINGQQMVFNGFAPFGTFDFDVANIIQQPTTNGDSNSSAAPTSAPAWLLLGDSVNNNINQLKDQAAQDYRNSLSKVKINPYCYANTGGV